MLHKPYLAKCGDRTILPKAHPTCGGPEVWLSNEALHPHGLYGITFDFFINWSSNSPHVSPAIWIKRTLLPPATYQQFSCNLEANVRREFDAAYLDRVLAFAAAFELQLQLVIFRDDFDWQNQKSEILLVDVTGISARSLSLNPAVIHLEAFRQLIKAHSGGSVRLGNKGLGFGTSNLECFLAGTDTLYPGDVDLVLLDEANQPKALLEFKKHSLATPIQAQCLANYYPQPDGRKYNRLAILKEYLSTMLGEDVPLLVLYYPTAPGTTEGVIELLQGHSGSLATKTKVNFTLPQAAAPEAFSDTISLLKDVLYKHAINGTAEAVRIAVPEKLLLKIEEYLKCHNLGNRGVEDGDKRKQQVGLLGELLTHAYLHGNLPDLDKKTDGFDGGFDILFRNHRIDVKTMERKSFVKPEYVNNFYMLQEGHRADLLVFCSYHATANILELCGWIPKQELATRGRFYAAGTKRTRADGSSFCFRQDNYEVQNKELHAITRLRSIAVKV
ncbi:hypothetical protein [Pontibacter akesuensis]|nr:hypothetical protein [Pontibacter akesuensis]